MHLRMTQVGGLDGVPGPLLTNEPTDGRYSPILFPWCFPAFQINKWILKKRKERKKSGVGSYKIGAKWPKSYFHLNRTIRFPEIWVSNSPADSRNSLLLTKLDQSTKPRKGNTRAVLTFNYTLAACTCKYMWLSAKYHQEANRNVQKISNPLPPTWPYHMAVKSNMIYLKKFIYLKGRVAKGGRDTHRERDFAHTGSLPKRQW